VSAAPRPKSSVVVYCVDDMDFVGDGRKRSLAESHSWLEVHDEGDHSGAAARGSFLSMNYPWAALAIESVAIRSRKKAPEKALRERTGW
jgi:hypothetical protein